MAAKKKDDKTLLIALLLGAGVYLLTRKQGGGTTTQQNPPPTYQQVPPAPAQNTQAWQQWVASIISVFGTAASLWAPGGPFHKQPLSQTQAIEIAQGQDYGDYA